MVVRGNGQRHNLVQGHAPGQEPRSAWVLHAIHCHCPLTLCVRVSAITIRPTSLYGGSRATDWRTMQMCALRRYYRATCLPLLQLHYCCLLLLLRKVNPLLNSYVQLYSIFLTTGNCTLCTHSRPARRRSGQLTALSRITLLSGPLLLVSRRCWANYIWEMFQFIF